MWQQSQSQGSRQDARRGKGVHRPGRRRDPVPPQLALFVTCASGLEPLLADELEDLGCKNVRIRLRGVYVPDMSIETIYKINYFSRIASRVVLPLRNFVCGGRDDLYRETGKIDWARYLPVGRTFAIDSNVNHPQLRNSLFAAQVMKDAICDQLRKRCGQRPSVDVKAPDVQLNLHIDGGIATISFDTSGTPLFKRGCRHSSVEAPLPETLAAAILQHAGYDGSQTLGDPCCGSGTLLIEAAMIATNTPSGYYRAHWGFMNHPDHLSKKWKKLRQEWDAQRTKLDPEKFWGIDFKPKAANENLSRAGFQIQVVKGSFQEAEVPPVDLVVTNPPHGRRLDADLEPLYADLSSFLRTHAKRALVLATEEANLSYTDRIFLKSGGQEVCLLEVECGGS